MDPDVERITGALGVNEQEREEAEALWWALIEVHDSGAAHCWRTAVAIEEAVVWRVLALRMLRDLGQRGLFQEREHGAYKGTVTTHPGIDGLAKTYERMRTRMDELMAAFDADGGAPAGLPDVMMEVLRQTEGVLEAALRPGSGEEGVERSRDSSGDEEPLAGRTSP